MLVVLVIVLEDVIAVVKPVVPAIVIQLARINVCQHALLIAEHLVIQVVQILVIQHVIILVVLIVLVALPEIILKLP